MKEWMPETGDWADRGPRWRSTIDRAFDDPTPSLRRLADLDPGHKTPTHVPSPEAAAWLRADSRARREDTARHRGNERAIGGGTDERNPGSGLNYKHGKASTAAHAPTIGVPR